MGRRRHRPTKIPQVSSREMEKILTRVCYRFSNQRGDERILVPKCTSLGERTLPVNVPRRKTLAKDTLHRILKRADISRNEFLDLLYDD